MSKETQYEVQPLAWVVKPKGDTVDGDTATSITRTHEGDGQFLEVSQFGGKIQITIEEWPAIRQAIEAAFDAILVDELHEFAPPVDPPPAAPQDEPTDPLPCLTRALRRLSAPLDAARRREARERWHRGDA